MTFPDADPNPLPPPDDWRPGTLKIETLVYCCPACGGLRVRFHGGNYADSTIFRWSCLVCSHRWKSPHRGGGRVTLVK